MSVLSLDFRGKVALVTGGGSGMGRAASLLFAQSGARVVLGDVHPGGAETVEAIKAGGGEALFVPADMTTADDVRNLMETAVRTYGGLNCAFNNAGVLPSTALLADTDEAAFDQTFAVDVKGV